MADSSRELLDAAYSQLGYDDDDGKLLPATANPTKSTSQAWVDKGDWLALANKVGAEKVFFVDNNPVIVFARQPSPDPGEWLRWFNSVWCMARPQLLFLASEGELVVFNLTRRPARKGEQRNSDERELEVVKAAAEVQEKLAKYRREQVESGLLFEDRRFGSDDRADRALIRDLGRVRRALIGDGQSSKLVKYTHAVIGRSIFIRYLEDRGVLVEAYFRQVANKGEKRAWNAMLDEDVAAEKAVWSGKNLFYPRVLKDKDFTYALFHKLNQDFNGDMFPVENEEKQYIKTNHLLQLRQFLLGEASENLFFYAYQFEFIPIELISSIYEKFYSTKPDQQRDTGSYYTPAALVEFVMSQTLDERCLAKQPRIMDPACGSGIFLVEAFRRIVRHRIKQMDSKPTLDEMRTMLRSILREQIRGMDISPEAIRVAAFSLYLAMLHYLEPSDILQHKQLPCLTYAERTKTDPEKHFDILLASDAFGVEEKVPPGTVRDRFTSDCTEIVVGNPPWGTPKGNIPEELQSDGGIAWCEERGLSVGDQERSQTFIHRTMDLLTEGGRAGLLVSTGVFFKRHDKTKEFREQWLSNVILRKVVNFTAVRKAFFRAKGSKSEGEGKGAIAPFASVVFEKTAPQDDSRFVYWSAKESAFVKQVQAVILNRADFTHAKQADYQRDDTLWKIYWWGSHRDEALIHRLRLEHTFGKSLDPHDDNFRIGWEEGKKDRKPSGWLRQFKEYPTELFERYGQLPVGEFNDPPLKVRRRCVKEIFQGARLLIKRGVGTKGRIIARFEDLPFSFRHSIYCMKVSHLETVNAKIVLGILWSSLTRYFLFMTSGSWGPWHDAVHKDTLKDIPIRFPNAKAVGKRIEKLVDELRGLPNAVAEYPLLFEKGLTTNQRLARVRKLEARLDEAVFDLFDFSEEERDRVKEFCSLGLDLFYRGMKSEAVKPLDWLKDTPHFGRMDDLKNRNVGGELGDYLRTYLGLWEPHLKEQNGRLRWRVVQPSGESPMMAVLFQTESEGDELPPPNPSNEEEWHTVLERVKENAWQSGGSDRIYIDGMVRVVTDTDIVIVKRNERRLWTASAARDDAEATMLLTMQLAEELDRRG